MTLLSFPPRSRHSTSSFTVAANPRLGPFLHQDPCFGIAGFGDAITPLARQVAPWQPLAVHTALFHYTHYDPPRFRKFLLLQESRWNIRVHSPSCYFICSGCSIFLFSRSTPQGSRCQPLFCIDMPSFLSCCHVASVSCWIWALFEQVAVFLGYPLWRKEPIPWSRTFPNASDWFPPPHCFDHKQTFLSDFWLDFSASNYLPPNRGHTFAYLPILRYCSD